jgi:sRNA-binding protein
MAGGRDRGAVLWNLTGNEAIGKPKRTLLPVLVVLFVVSYGLLTMLVVEQARTIDSQRNLIGLLFDDSVQLAGIRSKAIYKQNSAARERAQAEAQSHAKAPAAQMSPQDSQTKAPPTEATPSADAKTHGSTKMRRRLPLKPPKGASDEGDERRMSLRI